MSKLGIREFKGIYSNISSVDRNTDFVQDAENMVFENGYCHTEQLSISEVNEFELPSEWADLAIEALEYSYVSDDIYRKKVTTFSNKEVQVVVYTIPTGRYIKYKSEETELVEYREDPDDDELQFISGKSYVVHDSGVIRIYTPKTYYILQWINDGLVLTNMGLFTRSSGNLTFKQILESGVVEQNKAGVELYLTLEDSLSDFITSTVPLRFKIVNKDTGVVILGDKWWRVWYEQERNTQSFKLRVELDMYWDIAEDTESTSLGHPITEAGLSLPLGWDGGNSFYGFYIGKAVGGNPREAMRSLLDDFLNGTSGTTVLQQNFQLLLDFNLYYDLITIDEDSGFDANRVDFLLTYIFDKKTEIVVASYSLDASNTTSEYGVQFDLTPPNWLSKRVTGMRLYAKERLTTDEESYEYQDYNEYKFFDLTRTDTVYLFVVLAIDDSGVPLTNNIGLFYKNETYKLITGGIEVYKKVDGIGYILYKERLYGSTIGAGNIQDETFYEPEALTMFQEGKIQYIADINNSLGVITKGTVHLLAATDISGALVYTVKDTMNLQFKDYRDIVESAEGIFIHSSQGIYVTNGFAKTLVSEAINDVIIANYENASIFYNEAYDELYYYAGTNMWRFILRTKTWTKHPYDIGELVWITEKQDGNIIIASSNLILSLGHTTVVAKAVLDYGVLDFGDALSFKVVFDTTLILRVNPSQSLSGKVILECQGKEYVTSERQINISNDNAFVYIRHRIPVNIERRPKRLVALKYKFYNIDLVVEAIELRYGIVTEEDYF